jgi:lipopolysaccharide assembly outer membrane protein LptD (OstA)
MKKMETLQLKKSSQNVKEVNKKDSSTKNEELIQRLQVPESPFTVITAEGKSFGVMGEYRITEDYDDKEDVRNELEKITWNRMVQVFMILQEVTKDKEFKELVNKSK